MATERPKPKKAFIIYTLEREWQFSLHIDKADLLTGDWTPACLENLKAFYPDHNVNVLRVLTEEEFK